MKPALLYVTHRIPFPPNKGDKIRTYHFLKYLAERFRVYLATFIDNKADLAHRKRIESLCEEVFVARVDPKTAKIKSLAGLLRNEALTCSYYRHREMKNWIRDTVDRERIDNLFVSSSGVASLVLDLRFADANRIIDFIDMDSEKWRQYASHTPWPLSAVYKREARELFRFEQELARQFRCSLFVSESEAQLFSERTGCNSAAIDFVSNGVDLEYFSAERHCDSPYPSNEPVIVFSGAMDYRPNVDAVVYFAERVFPLVRKKLPTAKFVVVGGNPDKAVRALAARENIVVKGWVEDVRPYVLHASVSVAPLRIARGVQNKVLESMAMEVPTVVTPEALEGIAASPGVDVLVGRSASEFAANVVAVLRGDIDRREIGNAGRALVVRKFSWNENLRKLDKYFPLVAADEDSQRTAAGL